MTNPSSPLKVLVTGGSGKIGRRVVNELRERGHAVRILTSRTDLPDSTPTVEWRTHDWRTDIDFTAHVAGCDAIIHLGGETWRTEHMQRINADATDALVRAAEREGVQFMAYTSSIAVYGSARTRMVTEASPVVTTKTEIKSEVRGNQSFRTYARTKLMGEESIRKHAAKVNYLIVRPTIVVDSADIEALANTSKANRILLGARHMHFVHVDDVAHMLVAFTEKGARSGMAPQITTLNLSDDDSEIQTLSQFLTAAHKATGDARLRPGIAAPIGVYDLADMAKNRTFSTRLPIGRMHFSNKALLATGYRFRDGMDKKFAEAIRRLSGKQ